jgi:hypothetical protein
MEKSVAFAIPSLTHQVSIEFLRSIMRTDWLLAQHGWQRTYLDVCGNQFIANARNELAHDFLTNHPDCDNFFFLDDDLGWEAERAVEILSRDEDIIAGVYPKRQDPVDWPVMLAGDEGRLHLKDGLVRAIRVPTGFMRIKRRVLEGLVPHAQTYKWLTDKGETKEIPALFSVGLMPDGWFWTEDYIFCHNAGVAGFEVWVHPDIEFSHRGPKAWKGNLRSTLPTFRKRARQAYKQRVADEAAFKQSTAA